MQWYNSLAKPSSLYTLLLSYILSVIKYIQTFYYHYSITAVFLKVVVVEVCSVCSHLYHEERNHKYFYWLLLTFFTEVGFKLVVYLQLNWSHSTEISYQRPQKLFCSYRCQSHNKAGVCVISSPKNETFFRAKLFLKVLLA